MNEPRRKILFVPNLGAEVEFAGAKLPNRLREKLAEIGRRAFAPFAGPDDDVDTEDLGRRDLREALVVPWIMTGSIERAVGETERLPAPNRFEPEPVRIDAARLMDKVRGLTSVPADVVRDVADRNWWRCRFGEPESRLLERDELRARVDDPGLVAKSRYGSAGRGVVRLGSADSKSRVQRLPGPSLIVEPWHDREVDFGVCGFVDLDTWSLASVHEIHTNAGGGFEGIRIAEDRCRPHSASEEEVDALIREASRIAMALRESGYIGAFSVDGYRWRDSSGELHLRASCEANPRLTFGHVAVAMSRGLGAGVLEVGLEKCHFEEDR